MIKHLTEREPTLAPRKHTGGLSSREGLAALLHDGYMDGKQEVEPITDKRLLSVNQSLPTSCTKQVETATHFQPR